MDKAMKEQLLYRFSTFTKDELLLKLLDTDNYIEKRKKENDELKVKILEESKEMLLKYLYPNYKN